MRGNAGVATLVTIATPAESATVVLTESPGARDRARSSRLLSGCQRADEQVLALRSIPRPGIDPRFGRDATELRDSQGVAASIVLTRRFKLEGGVRRPANLAQGGPV